jgi:hypothetical protein
MENGCPKCENKLKEAKWLYYDNRDLCIDCQIEEADHDVLVAMNRVEQLKKIKEKHELPTD